MRLQVGSLAVLDPYFSEKVVEWLGVDFNLNSNVLTCVPLFLSRALMYSYIHRYHAGNFADVQKHLALLYVLEYLAKKETPFGVIDAYAGEGVYDFQSFESKRNQEHRHGVYRLFNKRIKHPLVEKYLQCILQANEMPTVPPRYYPGSPALIAQMLRPEDTAHLVEGHPEAVSILKRYIGNNPSLHVHHRDALEAMEAMTPFKEKRGLVFIDPSYEVKEEFSAVMESVLRTHKKFSQAVIMIWYPILTQGRHQELINPLLQLEKVVKLEWRNPKKSEKSENLIGSGLLTINAPFQFAETMKEIELLNIFKE